MLLYSTLVRILEFHIVVPVMCADLVVGRVSYRACWVCLLSRFVPPSDFSELDVVDVASGGHYNEKGLRAKVDEIIGQLERPGAGLTLNALYINQRQWSFQVSFFCLRFQFDRYTEHMNSSLCGNKCAERVTRSMGSVSVLVFPVPKRRSRSSMVSAIPAFSAWSLPSFLCVLASDIKFLFFLFAQACRL
jgi:hypothetical protein